MWVSVRITWDLENSAQAQCLEADLCSFQDVLEGFDKHEILVVFNAEVKIKPQHSLSIRGFYFCDKAEDGQKNSFAKPSYNFAEKSDCSSYDCEFISLAEELETQLITMDKQILRSFPERCAKPLDVLKS